MCPPLWPLPSLQSKPPFWLPASTLVSCSVSTQNDPFTMQIGSRQSSNILKRLPVTELRIKFNPLSKADNTLQHLTSAYYSSFSHCHFALCSLSSSYICFLCTNFHLRASVPEICWAIGLECSGFIFLHSLSPIFVILVTNQIFLFQRTLP